jgi:N-acetylneuraminic acid mutarotase
MGLKRLRRLPAILIALAGVCLLSPRILARELTFQERVRAQESIERVYYFHQIGTTLPFEEAVPRSLLEHKVRTYLKQSAVLVEFWKTPVTDATLERELERMAAGTRLPERLLELYDALGNDPFLIKECLARQILVNRLSRNFFAFDAKIHHEARLEAEELHEKLADGRLDLLSNTHQGRFDVQLILEKPAGELGERGRTHPQGPRGVHPGSQKLSPEEFRSQRSRWPRVVREPSKVGEERDAFVIHVVLSETDEEVRGTAYRVPKTTWEEWWRKLEDRLDDGRLKPAAREGGRVPLPVINREAAETPCGPPDNTWDNGILDDVPDPRHSHTAIWTGSLMVIWGGFGGNFNNGGRYDPATDSWTQISTINAPSPRYEHTAVWTGSLMLVWGGRDSGGNFNTGGRYDPSTDSWTPISMVGAPSARQDFTTVWTGSLMVVWGGFGGGYLNNGGRYDPDTNSWTPTSVVNAPSGRGVHVAVWTGSLMVVWGGAGPGVSNDGGRYDPATDSWMPTSVSNAPSARSLSTAVWTGSLMVVWGGQKDGIYPDTGGRYDPATDTWTPTSTVNAPSGRREHTAVWTGSLMVVWGGDNATSVNFGGRYDPAADTWTPVSTAGAPSSRYLHTAIWTDSALMVVWGGVNGSGTKFNTGGRYNPATDSWTPTSTGNGPSARSSHAAVWTGNLMVIWGGTDSIGFPSQGGRYDPATDTWTPTSIQNAPNGRQSLTTVWTGSRMVVWGGYIGGTSYVNTGGRYDPISDTWAPTSTSNAPSGRAAHTAVWTGSLMVVWGGSGAGVLNSGGRYDPSTDSWTPTSTAGAPFQRSDHTAVWTGSLMLVWGGLFSGGGPAYFNTGGRYDPVSDSWTSTSTSNAPSARGRHTAVWTGSQMVVWGGYGGSGNYFNSGGRYDPVSNSWTPTSTVNAPSARDRHAAVWTGGLMVVWGGGADTTGGRYDPNTDSWTPTSTANAPVARSGPTAVWTGSFVMIWGGLAYIGSGGRLIVSGFPDVDGDGYPVCAGDCDDAKPDIYPGAPQVCDGENNDCNAPGWPSLVNTNEADNDQDSYSPCAGDCNDTDADAWLSPVEVTNLALAASVPTILSWDDQGAIAGPGTVYDLVSGGVSAAGVSFASGVCLQAGGSPSFSDTRANPAPGIGYWYLARANSTCGAGTYGTGQRDLTIPSCP